MAPTSAPSDPRCERCDSPLERQSGAALAGICPACLAEAALLGIRDGGSEETQILGTTPPVDLPQETLGRGSVLGPYKLSKLLGSGGFGEVWQASQSTPIKRQVAIKVLRADAAASEEVRARFRLELETLARLDHPNIAKVYDAGTTSGDRAYIVMELVRGLPITEFFDQNSIALADRLQIFATVCRAVQHAHRRGVVHRDIKPSNILISQSPNQDPTPLVIDFGIAKSIAEDSAAESLITLEGHIVGTPQYMSPEQAEGVRHAIDTRTDVYSLGAVLYEILVGDTPIDRESLREAGVVAMLEMIRTRNPLRPSSKVTTLGGGGDQSQAAAHRGLQRSDQLIRALTGELDWITLRALEKEPSRRYQSPDDLADDIERHLRDEPVRAIPPSRSYQLRKFVRRHLLGVSLAACLLLSLVAGLLTAIWLGQRANAAKQQTEIALGETKVALRTAREEAGRTLLEQAERSLESGNFLTAATKAAQAVGFDGFGRDLAAAPPDRLLPEGSSESERAKAIGRGALMMAPIPEWIEPVDEQHPSPIVDIEVASDREAILTISKNDAVLWTGSEMIHAWRFSMPSGHFGLTAGALSAERVALVSRSGEILLLDSADGKELARIQANQGELAGCCWIAPKLGASTTPVLTTLGQDGSLAFWDSGSLINRTKREPESRVSLKDGIPGTALAATSVGRRLVCGFGDGSGLIVTPSVGESGRLILSTTDFKSGTTDIVGAAIGIDGKRFAVITREAGSLWQLTPDPESPTGIAATETGQLGRLRRGQNTSVALSPDSSVVLGGSLDGSVRALPFDTAKTIWTSERTGPGNIAGAVAFARNGNMAIVSSGGATIRTDPKTGARPDKHLTLREIQRVPGNDYAIALGPDNKLYRTDAITGQVFGDPIDFELPVRSFAVSPLGNFVAICSSSGGCWVGRIDEQNHFAETHRFDQQPITDQPKLSPIRRVAWADDEQTLAILNSERLRIWKLSGANAGINDFAIPAPQTNLTDVEFGQGSRALILGADHSKIIYHWPSIDEPERVERITHDGKQMTSFAMSPDGRDLYYGLPEGIVRRRLGSEGRILGTASGALTPGAMKLRVSADGATVCAGSLSSRLIVINTANMARRIGFNGSQMKTRWIVPDGRRFSGQMSLGHRITYSRPPLLRTRRIGLGLEEIHTIDVAPNGKHLAVAEVKKSDVFLLDSVSGCPVTKIATALEEIRDVAFSTDGTLLAAGGGNGLGVWEVGTGRKVASLEFEANSPPESTVGSIAFLPRSDGERRLLLTRVQNDGRRFSTTLGVTQFVPLADQVVELTPTWDPVEGLEAGMIRNMTTSPKNTHRVALGFQGGFTVIVNSKTLEIEHRLHGHSSYQTGTAWSPSGSRIATTHLKRTIIWDAATGDRISTADQLHGQPVTFGADGDLVLVHDRGALTTWDLKSNTSGITIPIGLQTVSGLCSNPDGTKLWASSFQDGLIEIPLPNRQDMETDLLSLTHPGGPLRVIDGTPQTFPYSNELGQSGGYSKPNSRTNENPNQIQIDRIFESLDSHNWRDAIARFDRLARSNPNAAKDVGVPLITAIVATGKSEKKRGIARGDWLINHADALIENHTEVIAAEHPELKRVLEYQP